MTDFNLTPDAAADAMFGGGGNEQPNGQQQRQPDDIDMDAATQALFGTVDVDRGDLAPGDQHQPQPRQRNGDPLDPLSQEAADAMFGDGQQEQQRPEADNAQRDQQTQPVQIDRGDTAVTDDFANDYSRFASEAGMNSQQAQKLFDKMLPKVAERQQAEITKMHKQWSNESRSHFGDELTVVTGNARNALQSVEGGKELGKLLVESGLGNHKAVLRFLANVGKRGR